jgi:hypothetical protein
VKVLTLLMLAGFVAKILRKKSLKMTDVAVVSILIDCLKDLL